jgi:hypothetical protein
MGILDFFLSAAGGGIVGPIIGMATKAFGVWESAKKTDNDIKLMRAQSEMADKAAGWAAFQESQKGANATLSGLPANTAAWAATLYVAIEAFKSFTRPGLTWTAMGFVFYVWIASEAMERAAMRPELVFMGSTAFFWWFGERVMRPEGAKAKPAK